SLHNPLGGGYYPAGMSFDDAQELMRTGPAAFERAVKASLVRHVDAVNALAKRGMRFWDYGNAFLLEASRAGAAVTKPDGRFAYPSYVEDIMGPMCFDYGFGPFRWICTSGNENDLKATDAIAADVLSAMAGEAPSEIRQQTLDNLRWIRQAAANRLVV